MESKVAKSTYLDDQLRIYHVIDFVDYSAADAGLSETIAALHFPEIIIKWLTLAIYGSLPEGGEFEPFR